MISIRLAVPDRPGPRLATSNSGNRRNVTIFLT